MYSIVPSAAPTSIAEFAVDSQTLLVSWDPPPIYSLNGIITEYLARISAQETAEQSQHTTTGNMTSLNIGRLHPDYTYIYTLAAGTGIGRGPFSTFHSVRMPEDSKRVFFPYLVYVLT